jgi:hypothetical protein
MTAARIELRIDARLRRALTGKYPNLSATLRHFAHFWTGRVLNR